MYDTSFSRFYDGPDKIARTALNPVQREKFYKSAVDLTPVNLEAALCGRVLMDFGLRVGELSHITESWIKRRKHPKTGNLHWCIDIPKGERCIGGSGSKEESSNMYHKGQPCFECRNRLYGDKDWVDDEFHEKYPFHPKSRASFRTVIWALPKDSCRETAQLLKGFLTPRRQFPVGRKAIANNVARIADDAGIKRHVTNHALRHTYGMRLAAAGKTLNDIMNQMRHNSIAMARYYSDEGGTDTLDAIQRSWDADEDF